MKTLIVILIIASFLQSTILPMDLILIILICRSYTRSDKANFYLAFFFGIFVAFLQLIPLGLLSLIYMVCVYITANLSRSRLSGNLFWIMPLTFCFLLLNQLVALLLFHHPLEIFPKIFLESVFSLPVLYLVKLWEERFIVQKGIKLRV